MLGSIQLNFFSLLKFDRLDSMAKINLRKGFKLRPLAVILKMHSLSELRAIYLEIFEEDAPRELTFLQLVKTISSQTNFDDLMEVWESKMYAHNTTLKTYQFLETKTLSPIKNGILKIKKMFSTEDWEKLTTEGISPNVMTVEPKLMHISQIGDDKYYFLFVFPGRSKEVIEGLSVRYIPQPQFCIAVWYNDKALLQIRGQENQSVLALKFLKYLKGGEGDTVELKHIKIQDKEIFGKLKKELDGRGINGKVSNPLAEVSDLQLKANPNKELFDTKMYKSLVKRNYNLTDAGIDFVFKKTNYTLWVGFKMGTLWLRTGAASEDLLNHLQEKLLKVCK